MERIPIEKDRCMFTSSTETLENLFKLIKSSWLLYRYQVPSAPSCNKLCRTENSSCAEQLLPTCFSVLAGQSTSCWKFDLKSCWCFIKAALYDLTFRKHTTTQYQVNTVCMLLTLQKPQTTDLKVYITAYQNNFSALLLSSVWT